MIAKPKECIGCPMYNIGTGFVPFELKPGYDLAVGEAPGEEEAKVGKCFSGGSGRWLRNMTAKAGISWDKLTLTNTILCRPPDNVYPTDREATYLSPADARAAVEHCSRVHLQPNLRKAAKRRVFAIGGQALETLTGRRGIYLWRGSVLQQKGVVGPPNVIPTIHPAALMRQAKFTSVAVRDLKRQLTIAPENYNLFPSLPDVLRFKSTKFAFDFEWDRDGNVTICGLSDRFYGALVVPFFGDYIPVLREIFERATHLIGHNIIGADLKYIEKFGWKLRDDLEIEDTMLKQHLCQPDYPHDLAFVASIFTSKIFWKGKRWEEMDEENEFDGSPTGQQWRTWDQPNAIPRRYGGYGGCLSAQEAFSLYNARDTDAEYQINTPLDSMLERYSLQELYRNVSVPAGYICRDLNEPGLRIDLDRLTQVRTTIDGEIEELEAKLPEGLRPYTKEVSCNVQAPEGTYRPKTKTCKGNRKEPHEAWLGVFNEPGETACPICQRRVASGKMQFAKVIKGTRTEKVVPYNSPPKVQAYVDSLGLKEVLDHKTGRRTTGKKARAGWAKDHPEFVLLGAVKQRVTLRNNFAKDKLLEAAANEPRMYFSLKVHGTSEGRLSCVGQRRGVDLNIQNQPKGFRSIYVPDLPDWGFLSLDIVQGENFLTAWIAQDWERWERLQDLEYDEHGDLAGRIFNRPVTKAGASADAALDALRQIGKKINHGRNYGMGVRKQKEELAAVGYDYYSEADVKEFIEIWKKMNARTAKWQKETIEIAQRQGYLRNAFGRVRWFSSRSIATESLAFLPASTLADTVLRMMICHFPERWYPQIQANQTAVFHPLVPEWRMSIQVHDELAFQGPFSTVHEQRERSEQIMTQPWPQLNGFRFRVESKGSPSSWGECNKKFK